MSYLHRIALFSVLLASSLSAQTPPCESFNDTTSTTSGALSAFGFGGPNTRAWQVVPTNTYTIQSVRLFTGNSTLSGDRYMTVEIWSDVNNLPGARLGGGTWKIDQTMPLRWQGANLDQSIAVNPNTKIWVVWIDPGFSEIPVESGGLTLLTATRSGVTWTAVTNTAPKVRLFCNLLDDLGVGNNGGPCLGTNGAYATAFTNYEPTIANTQFSIEASGFLPGQAALMALGVIPGFPVVPLAIQPPGCTQNTDVFDSYFAFTGTSNVRGPTAAGHVRYSLSIPNDPGLVGGFVALQVACFDTASGASLPLVTTNAVTLVIR